MKKIIFIVLCIFSLLTACSEKNGQDQVSDSKNNNGEETIVLGYIPTFKNNTMNQYGLHLAVKEANEKKLVIGNKTIHFKLKVISHEELNQINTKKLSTSSINAVFGQIGPNAMAFIQQNQLLGMSFLMNEPIDVTPSDNKNLLVFYLLPNDQQQADLIAKDLSKQNIQKVAVVSQDLHSLFVKELHEQLQKNNIITNTYLFNHANQLTDLKKQFAVFKPDLVFYDGNTNKSIKLIKMMQKNHLLIPTMFTIQVLNKTFMAKAEKYSPGSMAVIAGLPLSAMKSAADFSDSFEKNYQIKPDIYAINAYDSVWAVITAMKLADSTAISSYLPKLKSINLTGELLSGPLTFNNNGIRNEVAMSVYQVEDNKWKLANVLKSNAN